MNLNKYHKPFKDSSNFDFYLQLLIILIVIVPVKGKLFAYLKLFFLFIILQFINKI